MQRRLSSRRCCVKEGNSVCICAALYIWGINLVRGAEGSQGQGLSCLIGLQERQAMAAVQSLGVCILSGELKGLTARVCLQV